MPTARTFTRRVARTSASALLIAGVLGAGTVLTATSASAATLVADSCRSTTDGQVGQTIAISGESISQQAYDGAKDEAELINGVNPDQVRQAALKIESIPVGTVADRASTSVTGEKIAAATERALRSAKGLNGPLDLTGKQKADTLAAIGKKVSAQCTGMSVRAVNHTAPSSASAEQKPQQSHTIPADPTSSVGSTFTPPTGSSPSAPGFSLTGGANGRQAPRDYSGIPLEKPGSFAPSPAQKYGTGKGIPGYAPQFGQLPSAAGPNGDDPVQNAGQARALDESQNPVNVSLPMLLAVLALAGVTAALVRTWALRRASVSTSQA